MLVKEAISTPQFRVRVARVEQDGECLGECRLDCALPANGCGVVAPTVFRNAREDLPRRAVAESLAEYLRLTGGRSASKVRDDGRHVGP